MAYTPDLVDEWRRFFGNNDGYHTINAVVTDSNNNVYVTGKIEDGTFSSVVVDTTDISLTAVGNSDLFVIKYDSSGNYQWHFQKGEAGTDSEGTCIVIDNDNNSVFVGGKYNDFSYIVKLDVSDGTIAPNWEIFGTESLISGLAKDSTLTYGNLYSVEEDQDVSGLVVSRYGPNGGSPTQSAQIISYGAYINEPQIVVDSTNNVYVSAKCKDNVIANSSDGSTTNINFTHNNTQNVFAVMYNFLLIVQQYKIVVESTEWDAAHDMVIDSNDYIYICGKDNDGSFIHKYQTFTSNIPSQDLLWNFHVSDKYTLTNTIDVDSSDNVYVGGKCDVSNSHIYDILGMDTPKYSIKTASASNHVTSVIKYDPDGNLQWVKERNSQNNNNAFKINEMEIDSNNEVYVVGETKGGFYFDQNGITYDSTTYGDLQSVTKNYGFTLKLGDGVNEAAGGDEPAAGGDDVATGPALCFKKGTPVQTDQGLIRIENINVKKHTIRNERIVAITKSIILQNTIICIEKNALFENIPSKTTYISKEHKLLYRGLMMKAKDLISYCKNVYEVPYNGEILYNVLMKKHNKMVVNNLVCETLHPDNIVSKIYNYSTCSKQRKQLFRKLQRIIENNQVQEYKNMYLSL